MKKSDIKQLINNSIKQRQLCRVNFNYDNNTWFLFPLLANDKLFLSASEEDFILNGYSVRRFKDTDTADCENGKIFSIIKYEGLIDKITTPEIDINDWQTVFESLKKLNKNIIVENEKAEDDEAGFIIGRIVKASKTKVIMQHFDAEGIWQEKLYEISYSKITSVSFDTRYINVFSKYI